MFRFFCILAPPPSCIWCRSHLLPPPVFVEVTRAPRLFRSRSPPAARLGLQATSATHSCCATAGLASCVSTAAVGLLVVGVLHAVPGLRGGQRLGAVTQLRVCEARPEGQAAACGCISSLRAAGGMLAPCSCSPFLAHLARILSQIW